MTKIKDLMLEPGRPFVTPYMYGAKGDGITSDVAALTAACATGKPVMIPPGTFKIDADTTCTAPIIYQGGIFVISYGKTLTLTGPQDGPISQRFLGSGRVSFAGNYYVHELYAAYWGAKADDSTDSYAAINNAIIAAAGVIKVKLQSGIYRSSQGFSITLPKTFIEGSYDSWQYGTGAGRTSIKFTGGTVGFTAGDVPYVNLKDLTIDGNSILQVGWDRGYFVTWENVSVIGCTVAGFRAEGAAQGSYFKNVAFNGNGDGFKSVNPTYLTTFTFDNCIFRQNTQHGYNGTFGSGTLFIKPIFESNGSQGVHLVGIANNVTLLNPYFEQNDNALGASGYNLYAALADGSAGIVFENGIFGATGLTKIANIVSGSIEFRNCSQAGSKLTQQITLADGAEAILYKSFLTYPMPQGVKILPEVSVDPSKAANFPLYSYLDISPLALSFGAGDFSVNITLSFNRISASARPILLGNTSGFSLLALGSTEGMTVLNFYKQGSASFHSSPEIDMRFDNPAHIVYSRISSIGHLYLNGVLVESFADTNDYSGTELNIGRDASETLHLKARLYAMSFHSVGLIFSDVISLWRNGGDPLLAGSPNITFNIDPSIRPSTGIYDSVSGTVTGFLGGAVWLSPNSWSGKTSVANGGTIAHGMGITPRSAICTPSVSGEMCSITGLSSTNITVAIIKNDGTAGTTQNVYWQASK